MPHATHTRRGAAALKALWLILLLAGLAGCLAAVGRERALGGGAVLHYGLRVALIVLGLTFWFLSQSLIGSRPCRPGEITDTVHELTAPLHAWLTARPRIADRVLIVSSAVIDAFGVFLLAYSVLGPSMRPFVALLAVFVLRQSCQGTCGLPAPPGMIWRDPGVPSLLVTYGVGNDFFFSGHTSIALLGAIELARISPVLGVVGGVLALGEMAVVLILRAHYTMDVLAAIAATWCAVSLTGWLVRF